MTINDNSPAPTQSIESIFTEFAKDRPCPENCDHRVCEPILEFDGSVRRLHTQLIAEWSPDLRIEASCESFHTADDIADGPWTLSFPPLARLAGLPGAAEGLQRAFAFGMTLGRDGAR